MPTPQRCDSLKHTYDRATAKPIAKPGIYYGYITIVLVGLILMVGLGTPSCFGIFFKPMLEEFGWTRAVTSGPYSLAAIMFGTSGIIAGKLNDRFGPRLVITIGGIVSGSGLLLMSTVSNLVQFYLFFGVLATGGAGLIMVPSLANLTRWFVRRRELILGIGSSGLGLGMAVVPPLANALMVSHGWRFSLVVLGLCSLVIVAVLGQFLKREPEINDAEGITQPPGSGASGLTLKQSVHTRQFWLLVVTWFLYGFYWQAGTVHLIPHATDIGMSPAAAASVFVVLGFVGIPGRLLSGAAGYRFGSRATMLISYILVGVVYLGLTLVHSPWMLYLFAVIFGLVGGVGLLLSVIIANIFGLRELGIIMGFVLFGNSVGSAVGPVVAGYLFDTTLTYNWAFLLCAAAGLGGALVYSFFRPLER